MNITDLEIGGEGIITSFSNSDLEERFEKLGLVKGEKITLKRIAPLGDPLVVVIDQYQLCIRVQEAALINIDVHS